MKKILIGFFILYNGIMIAQNFETKGLEPKFQFELHYVGNVRNQNIISNGFNGVIGFSSNYSFFQNQKISFSGGLKVDYLQSRDVFLPKDIIIWNPNASVEIALFNRKIKPFLGIGYAFFTNEIRFASGLLDSFDPILIEREKKLRFNGITINSGLRIPLSKLLFLEGSYTYFPVSSDDFVDSANVHFINFGLGIKI
jgi:hypothetical protein